MNNIIHKPKVVIVLTNSFPFGNGEPYLNTELPYLVSAFNKVRFFPINPSGVLPEKLNDGISIIKNDNFTFKKPLSYLKLLLVFIKETSLIIKLPNVLYHLRYYWSYLQHKNKLAGVLKNEIDSLINTHEIYIYSYWFNDLAIISSLVKNKFPCIKIISRAHGFDIFEQQNKNSYIPFNYFKLKYTDRVYSVSKRGELHLKNNFTTYKNKIYTSYLGSVDGGVSILNSELEFAIVTCSIIRNIKRLELMIDILKNIDYKITWHVIGNGVDEERLKKESLDLPKNISVIFHGYYTQQQLFDFYKNNSINLFCSLSSSEGLPVSMMEAISFGIPIMSTDVGGCSEICNEHTGFLIDKEFIATEIASKITEFKNSNKNTTLFRDHVRKYWQSNFSADKNYNWFMDNAFLIDA